MRIKFGPAFSGANILKKENKNGEKSQCYEVRFGEGNRAEIHH